MPRASAFLLILLILLFGALATRAIPPALAAEADAPARTAASRSMDRTKIAILEFEPVTATARKNEKGRLVSEMLTTAAVKSGRFEVVERRIISRLLEELEFGERGLTYTSAALKVGAMAGATAILSGSVAEDDGKTRIDARFIDVETGRILWAGVAMGGGSLSGVSDATNRIFRDLDAYAAASGPALAPRTGREAAPAEALPSPGDDAPDSGLGLPQDEDIPGPRPDTPSSRLGGDGPGGGAQAPDMAPPDPEKARRAAAHHQAAREHGRAKRYAKAAREMDLALALDPGRAEYHAARGHARYFLGRYAEALADYDQSLALDAGTAAVHSMRALCLTALHRPAEAAEAYDQAVALSPGNPDLLIRRGRLRGAMGLSQPMCQDLLAACDLGQCQPLENARKEGTCPAAP
ncbi:MAG: FlgO family outer membrane protein [Desulfovibrionaceae bacterium]|nr:FlgO family outer membrane protein [Desulfovibrionaceae bacterium]